MAISEMILEEHGYFWWDDEIAESDSPLPKSAVSGYLQISDDGLAYLELHGALAGDAHATSAIFSQGENPRPSGGIFGILKSSASQIILLDLAWAGGSSRPKGISYQKLRAGKCLIGKSKKFLQLAKLTFSGLKVDLSGFEEWAGSSKIESTRSNRSCKTKYTKTPTSTYALVDGKISLLFDLYFSSEENEARSINLKEQCFFEYKFKKEKSISELLQNYRMLQDILLLLTGSTLNLEWPTLYTRNQEAFVIYFWRQKIDARKIDFFDIPFPFEKVKNIFGNIFINLTKKREQIGPGIYMYFGARRNTALYIEHRFASFVWGLEALHRRTASESKTPLEEKIERILSNIELKKDRQWLEKKLEHAGEPSLSDRLYEVISGLNFDLKELKNFCDDCANSRNDISHFGGNKNKKNYDSFLNDLIIKSDALSYIYHAVLLKEIGIPTNDIANWLTRSPQGFRAKFALERVGLIKGSDQS